MMAHYTYTRRAETDLIDIWTFVAEDNPAAADRLLDQIETACIHLAENPNLGPARPDLAAELRYFIVGNYLLLYRQTKPGIEIVRVVHGARQLSRLLREI